MKKPRTKTGDIDYILKNIPIDLWMECQAQADKSKSNMRWVILGLLDQYRAGHIKHAPPSLAVGADVGAIGETPVRKPPVPRKVGIGNFKLPARKGSKARKRPLYGPDLSKCF